MGERPQLLREGAVATEWDAPAGYLREEPDHAQ